MMAARASLPHLIDRLPAVRGELLADAPLAPLTWFRVGGPAEVMFRPADADDLATFLAGCPADVPVTVIGVGSNLLVRDGGVPGVVIRLGRAFMEISIDGSFVRAGTATLDVAVARAAQEAGLAGLEFYRGIPGSIGGALRMNGGAYGRETKDVLVEAVAIDRAGKRHVLKNADMKYSYRHCGAADDLIFVEAVFQGTPGDKAAVQARMDEITSSREATQPIRTRTGGSTFKNPDGHKSWQLIDAAGCRGLKRGGAQVSELHCNFLINTGDASAADLEDLGEEVRARVKAQSGVTLEWEIRRIGTRNDGGGA
ncbi:MAG: UDP-N-acetylenolpyruvoylglucosamine reductase [Alphaproteobacteria bacterium HGW-Alphaproteobacteria-11]|nr:MAG: UDP-N-acetylenolpyruvoylglucosamine reductase [Alphaproteobacteria bacterium HGW-Alphaproteobacteria-11]